MPLNPADIAVVSQLLDQALALPEAEREAWLAALPAEHQVHLQTLRDMLAQEAQLDTDSRLAALPRLPPDETVARADDRVGPYRLIREIGRGGMGSVWLAERADGSYKRQLALKLPRLAWGAGLAERMARERDIGALLEHPNIARLYDAGVDERGRPYLALEFVDGQPIDAWCAAQGLGVRERLKLFVQVARAVAYAHGRLVVHRDLKPSNVLVTADGQAHLLDFGIAKLLTEAVPGEAGLTQEQGRVLTPHYASPEQVAGEAITVQSDVYSLGVLLYELLTGSLPIEARRGSLGAVEAAILEGDAPLASRKVKDAATARALRGEVDAILAKAMQREPARRYATADALALDIERHLNGEAVSAQPDSALYRLRKAIRRHRVGFAAAGTVMVAVLGGAGVSIVQANRANEAAERARVVKEFVVDIFKVNERATPVNNDLRQLPVEVLLERGAKLIESKFSGQPRLQSELYGVVGGIFADMGAPALAATYATKQSEALTTAGADRIEQSRALVLLAQALLANGQLAEAEPRARRAVLLSAGEDEAGIQARLTLVHVLVEKADYERATKELQSAQAAIEASQVPSQLALSRTTFFRAELSAARLNWEEAKALYDRAIEIALAAEGPLSRRAIDMRIALTMRLINSPKSADAKAYLDAAVQAMRTLGGADDIVAALAESKAISQLAHQWHVIPFDEAIAIVERNRALLANRAGRVPIFVKAQLDLLLGSAMWASGRAERGYELINASADTLRNVSDNPSEHALMARLVGEAAYTVGRHDQADRELRRSLDFYQRVTGRDPFLASYYYVLIAWNEIAQKKFAAAEAAFDASPAPDDVTSATPGQRQMIIEMQRNRAVLELERGNYEVALRIAERYPDVTFRSSPVTVGLIKGQALCGLGRAKEGLQVFENAIAEYAAFYWKYEYYQARLRGLAGLCALSAGQIERAKQLQQLAHEAFVQQPGVSPFFKAPLRELDAKLGRLGHKALVSDKR